MTSINPKEFKDGNLSGKEGRFTPARASQPLTTIELGDRQQGEAITYRLDGEPLSAREM